eukprot:3390924-Pleurochrysis_carterae.AAC.1
MELASGKNALHVGVAKEYKGESFRSTRQKVRSVRTHQKGRSVEIGPEPGCGARAFPARCTTL